MCYRLIWVLLCLALANSVYAKGISKFNQNPWNNDPTALDQDSKTNTRIHRYPDKFNNIRKDDTPEYTDRSYDEPKTLEKDKQYLDDTLSDFFTQGTYTLAMLGTYVYYLNNSYWGYGPNLFVQSGDVGGFSVGANYNMANPFFSNELNPFPKDQQYFYAPTNKVLTFSEAYLQYQYKDTFQVNAGWLYIETPWLTSQNAMAVTEATFQGVLSSYQVTEDILLTALGINGFKFLQQTRFSGETMYSPDLNTWTGTPQIGSDSTPGAVALGGQYQPNKNFSLSGWGYTFFNYVSMLYADGGKTFELKSNYELTLNFQAATQSTLASGNNNIFTKNNLKSPGGHMLGAELVYSLSRSTFSVGYNSLFGGGENFRNGVLVSPYTYQVATDPLYTTSYLGGMVEKSAGHAVKLTSTFDFLNDNLSFFSSYAYYATTAVPDTMEADFMIDWQVQQLDGLHLFLDYSFLHSEKAGPFNIQDALGKGNGNSMMVQLMVTYLY